MFSKVLRVGFSIPLPEIEIERMLLLSADSSFVSLLKRVFLHFILEIIWSNFPITETQTRPSFRNNEGFCGKVNLSSKANHSSDVFLNFKIIYETYSSESNKESTAHVVWALVYIV